MKKFFSFVLSAALLLTLAVPAAAAEETADQRLAGVTAKVKAVLGIGDEYEEFYGELQEQELTPVWSLSWSREEDRIEVLATEEGKVLSYYLYENGSTAVPSVEGGGVLPVFPALSQEEAQARGEAFLKKVLDAPLETASFAERSAGRLNMSSYRFSGQIRLNGLDSPLTFSLSVRAGDGKVVRFCRDSLEQTTVGGVPSSRPSADKGRAGSLLKDTLSLRLEYVLEGSRAVLRYLPESGDAYYVDAQTGALVNLTELYKEVSKNYAAGGENGVAFDSAAQAPAEGAEEDRGLSQAELEGVAKLEGVLSKEALDKALREITQLGLDRYALTSASYSLDRETDDVTVSLLYTRRDDDGFWRRTVSCDGRTGALLSVYTSAPYAEERTAAVGQEEAGEIAEAFLAELWGDELADCALYDSTPWTPESYRASHGFTYVRQANGYFLPENSLRVSVDVTDGSISTLERCWTEDVVFDNPEGILNRAQALDVWFGHYDVALAYRYVPVKLDASFAESPYLQELGHAYFFALKLSYALEEESGAWGVDAKTGEIVCRNGGQEDSGLTYDDLEGHWARAQIEALAQYGIGWAQASCQPRKALTQLDLVALLASTDGYRYSPETEEADDLYRYAYGMGILTPAQREEDRELTRGETVELLLHCAGYDGVASLQGIFICSFGDREEIPESLLGYAALAQGLGVVSGEGDFAAGRTATRAEAAVMLYNYMSRQGK